MCPQHLEHKGHTVTGDSKGKLLIPQLCPQPQPPNCSYSLKSGKKKDIEPQVPSTSLSDKRLTNFGADPRAFRPSRNVALLTGVMTAKAVTDLG